MTISVETNLALALTTLFVAFSSDSTYWTTLAFRTVVFNISMAGQASITIVTCVALNTFTKTGRIRTLERDCSEVVTVARATIVLEGGSPMIF